MRSLRLSLLWMVSLALLGGMGGSAMAQDTEAPSFEEPHQVTGQILRYVTWRHGVSSWDGERRFQQTKGTYLENPIQMDDPRLSGLLRRVWNRDTYGGPVRAGLGEVMAARAEVVNDDGSWIGTNRGHVAYQNPRTFYWQFELTGTGAYEGHTALLYAKGPTGGPFEVEGFVFPGLLPDYPAELPAG